MRYTSSMGGRQIEALETEFLLFRPDGPEVYNPGSLRAVCSTSRKPKDVGKSCLLQKNCDFR